MLDEFDMEDRHGLVVQRAFSPLDKTLVSLGQRDPKESSRGSKGNSGTWVDIYTSNPLYKDIKKLVNLKSNGRLTMHFKNIEIIT